MFRRSLTVAAACAPLLLAGCGDPSELDELEDEPADTQPVEPPDTSPPRVDDDADGWAVDEGDCDDSDPAVNPGVDEICDGIDNDCDGYADLGAVDATSWWLDVDGDGYGCETCVASACEQPDGRVADNTDCDDEDSTVNPGEEELCDGIDNDCDGIVDGGCD